MGRARRRARAFASRGSRAARCRCIAGCRNGASSNKSFALRLNEINLDKVQAAIDAGKLDPGATVDAEALVKAGVLRRAKDGVRLLGGGEIKTRVAFSVWGASKSAVAAVEKAGGTVTILMPKRETGEQAA